MNRETENTIEGAKQAANRAAERAAESARATTRAAQRQARTIAGDLKAAGRQAIWGGQQRVAETVGQCEVAMRDVAGLLRRTAFGAAAGQVERVAALAGDTRHYLAETPSHEIWRDAEDCVRRHPAASFAAFLLAGMAVGRFLKSSTPGLNHGAARPSGSA